MVQRQGKRNTVPGGNYAGPQHRFHLGCNIGMAQWYTLGQSRGARGVKQGRLIFRSGLGQLHRPFRQ